MEHKHCGILRGRFTQADGELWTNVDNSVFWDFLACDLWIGQKDIHMEMIGREAMKRKARSVPQVLINR